MSSFKAEDITLNHIRILKAVDEYGSFSIAAQQLGYSQALISKKVKQIEDCLGVLLLNRSPGSISLTHKGKKLVAQTFGVVETVETLQEEFQTTLSAEGEDLILGATPLILNIWFKHYRSRFQLCFPGRTIKEKEVTEPTNAFSTAEYDLALDLLLNTTASYQEKHHCTRLTTHPMLLIALDDRFERHAADAIAIAEIDFKTVVILEELYRDLAKDEYLSPKLTAATLVVQLQEALRTAHRDHKLLILPDFCESWIRATYPCSSLLIQDMNEYGIYIHVPHLSELLVSAEGLVRSFRFDQDSLDHVPKINLRTVHVESAGSNVIRIGIQQDAIGQFIASYGVKYIADLQRSHSFESSTFSKIEIERDFELQVFPLASGEQLNRQMKRGELDLCILDDISLLNNGSRFFNDLSFGSKLIGIASYNVLGDDISIVLPRGSSIKTIQDLKGKRISTSLGSTAHRFIIVLFDLYGLDVSKDCRLVNEDSHTASMSLLNKTIDAHVCCNSFASILETYVLAKRLMPTQSRGLKIPSLRGIVGRSQFIKENPKFVIAYLHDLLIANQWFNANPVQAADLLSQFSGIHSQQIVRFFDVALGNRIDPTLKPQWSWLLKTLNRRLDGKYGVSLFDIDFWMDDYYLRLVYNLLDLDYHFHQVSFSSELSSSYFLEEAFSRHQKVFDLHDRPAPV